MSPVDLETQAATISPEVLAAPWERTKKALASTDQSLADLFTVKDIGKAAAAQPVRRF